MKTQLTCLLIGLSLCASPNPAAAQGTAFAYQGRLNNGSNPANGIYDLTFSLYNAYTGGTQTGSTVTDTAVGVTSGLFTATVDFGSGVFTGTPYWLQIGVRTNGTGTFTELTPRQPLTPAPYALYAESSGATALVHVQGTQSFFAGQDAGNQAQPGNYDTGVGYGALSANPGVYNSAIGNEALARNITGASDTAAGVFALEYNTTGGGNTAYGADVMAFNVSGNNNTAVGLGAIENSTSGSNNVAIGGLALGNKGPDNNLVAVGYQALENDAVVGSFVGSGANTAIGYQALQLDNSGAANTAVGYQSLNQNTSGYNDTASGFWSLLNNTTGYNNVANGFAALEVNTTGNNNTANGYAALSANITGNNNTANGSGALGANTTGTENVANGVNALASNTSGYNNAANGYQALYGNTTGFHNTAAGGSSLQNNLDGSGNVADGYEALYSHQSGNNNVAIGAGSIQTSSTDAGDTAVGGFALQNLIGGGNDIALGLNAGNNLINGANNIYIGNAGNATETGIIRIGTPGTQTLTYIAGTIENPTCNNINITGGADLAEPFPITAAAQMVAAGEVVVIDEANPGQLKLTDQPYDTHVAGVVSGANGIHPGIQMHQDGMLEGGKNVALSGRVYVQADTSNGAIKPGDLLTTSSTPGHAMKVSDHARAAGAILGKAMSGLSEGKGMVLVLVTLQ